jgi:hypothetical protein
MEIFRCDGCGLEMKRGELRYRVTIDVRAAYDELTVGLMDLLRDHRADLERLIEQRKDKDPKAVEESVYKQFKLDLCPRCQRGYLKDPLRFHPEQGAAEPVVDIDGFLRSLGIPPGEPGAE